MHLYNIPPIKKKIEETEVKIRNICNIKMNSSVLRQPLFRLDMANNKLAGSNLKKYLSGRNVLLWTSRVLRLLQLNWKVLITTITITLLSILWYYPMLFLLILFAFYSFILIIISSMCAVYIYFLYTTNGPPKLNREPLMTLQMAMQNNLFDPPNPIRNSSNLPIIFCKTVDLQLQQIIEYILRDFLTPWLKNVVIKPKLITNIIREDIWNAIQKLHERAKKLDASKMIAVEMVNRMTVHLEKIRIAESRAVENFGAPVFSTNSYLMNDEKEQEFLGKLCELILIILLPRGYSMAPLKILLCEIFSYKILFPLIKVVTSPDYINQKLVQNIEGRLAAVAISKRSFDYAASFEEFLKIINNTNNLEELSLIRKTIINDLLHATTMQNLQRSKGIDPDGESDHNLSKAEISAAAKLKRYIQQLTLAKAQCEKNLEKFGWNCNYANNIDLTLIEILNTSLGRRYLTLFLEPLKAGALVGFYVAVEEMKHSPKSTAHQLGTEIYYTYIRVPKPEIQIDKIEKKLIENFLLGNSDTDIFFSIQKQVLKTLEEKYYQPFVLSEQYRLLKDALDADDYKNSTLCINQIRKDHDDVATHDSLTSTDNITDDINTEESIDVAAQTTYARRKLEQIQERIDKKNQALEALKYSVKPDSKVLKMLEKEMEWLKDVKRQTEAHLTRTDAWTEHLGKWKATVQSVDMSDEKESVQYMILVHVDESCGKLEARPSNTSSGWVIMRTLNQVHELQRKLRHVKPSLKSFDLPTNFKFFFLKNDRAALEKAKQQTQKFLNMILEDDRLNGSEAIYTFLSPASDCLKHNLPSPKKSKFSLATLFKSENIKLSEALKSNESLWGLQREDEDLSIYLEGETSCADSKIFIDPDSKDSIAEPLYALMGEVFDMGGVFKWVRKSLISFVQITYGRTINRQIRESVSYLYEESMLHYYFSAILKSFWPGGVLASSYPERSDDMKEMTMNAAKALLMDNTPEILCNLVGAQAAKRGLLKVFDALQNPLYNKQLFYELLEIILIEIFPEIKQLKLRIKPTKVSNTNDSGNGTAVVTNTINTSNTTAINNNSNNLDSLRKSKNTNQYSQKQAQSAGV